MSADLKLLTHLIDGRRCLQKAKQQATELGQRDDIETALLAVERSIEEQVGEDWEEL